MPKCFSLAREGQLSDSEQCQKQVHRMLESPDAVRRSKQFISDWLNLHRLENMQPNKERFPTGNRLWVRTCVMKHWPTSNRSYGRTSSR